MVAYTTAERAYDWWFTRDLGDVATLVGGRNPKTVRKVEIEDGREEEQLARYASGLHMAADQVEYDKLVAYELVVAL